MRDHAAQYGFTNSVRLSVRHVVVVYLSQGTTHRQTFHHLVGASFYQLRQKSNPLKLFAVFSANAWNFCVKFYTFK